MRTPLLLIIVTVLAMTSCKTPSPKEEPKDSSFQFFIEQFADLKILRYPVLGFEELTLPQKELIYYLSQAAIEGRDIIFDQNYKCNLTVRRTLEAIYENYKGDRNSENFKAFEIYLKRVWFSNGIHHHYSSDKIDPGFNASFFAELLAGIDAEKLPLKE